MQQVKWEHSSTHLSREGPGGVLTIIPHPSTLHTWEESDDRTEWPEVTSEKMFSYYSEMAAAGVDGNAVRNAEDGFYPLVRGKVGPVLTHTHGSFVYLEASVGSVRMDESSSWYSAWVLVTEDGDVETAGCSCAAGQGGPSGCGHAAAILWMVENAVRRNAASKMKSGVQQQHSVSVSCGIRFKVKRHKKKSVYKPSSSSSSLSVSSKARPPAGEVTHYTSHEEWRQSRLRTSMAPFYSAISDSLVSAHFHSAPSAHREGPSVSAHFHSAPSAHREGPSVSAHFHSAPSAHCEGPSVSAHFHSAHCEGPSVSVHFHSAQCDQAMESH